MNNHAHQTGFTDVWPWAQTIGAAVILISGLVLAGWTLLAARPRSVVPGMTTWAPLGTAVVLALAGLSLWIIGRLAGPRCRFDRLEPDRRRAERRLDVQYTVTRVLAESPRLHDALPEILQSLCESLGWDFGAFWRVDPGADLLRSSDIWHSPSAHTEEFAELSRRTTFAPGVGLPGRVWASGQPAWIPDVISDPNFPRAAVADRAGLHGAFGFPIVVGSEFLGVMEVFSGEIQQPDPDRLQMLRAIGSQIGQFIKRKQAEEAMRQQEERFRSLVEATAAIRAQESLKGGHVPIIAMTAHALRGDRERCLEAGMDAYVAKPIRPRELFEALESLIPGVADAAALPGAERPAFEQTEALDRVDDDIDLLKELAGLFLEQAPRWMEQIRAALASRDARSLQETAHTLKGSVGNLSAQDAFEAARLLESCGREGNWSKTEGALTRLEAAMARLEPALAELCRAEVS
ncbi:MAG: GAF domain-containing protein [Isosphaeraceae bacterium]